MKKLNHIIPGLLFICAISLSARAQEKNSLMLSVGYNNVNNQQQYLLAQAKTKVDRKFVMVPGIAVKFFITNDSAANLLGTAITDEDGNAAIQIPASAKGQWDRSGKVSFIVESAPTKTFDAASGSFDLTKAKLKIDTAEDRKILVTLLELKDSAWSPVKGVDIKVAVKRQGGDLNVSETQTYATDSLGVAGADYKRDSLPGDSKGNLTLVAKVEDNDSYGTLSVEKSVPWGVATRYTSNYDQRTLFARRGRSPIWLTLLAYSIIGGVWGVLIYLVFQIRRLKQLGTAEA